MSAQSRGHRGQLPEGRSDGRAVEAVLEGAREKGAETRTFHLTEQHIEFCTNCRQCTQTPGEERGQCAQQDDLEPMLEEIEAADAVVLASPVNYYNVTAIFRRFLERLLGYTYWPWGQAAPKGRKTKAGKEGGAGGFCGNAGVSDSAGDRRG